MIGRGSEWYRWEPRIRAPGAILNNQFGAAYTWAPYLATIKCLSPQVEAIVVTDYLAADTASLERALRLRVGHNR